MSTNISEIMFEIESYGMPKDRVETVVKQLVMAGQRSVWASLGEMAGKRLVNLRDVEMIVGGLIGKSNKPSWMTGQHTEGEQGK